MKKPIQTATPGISEQLLLRLQSHPRDEEAWSYLDGLYRPVLLHWLQGYSLHAEDASDILQRVFEAVCRQIATYDPAKGDFRAWLKGILRNRLREFWRSKRRRDKFFRELSGEALTEIANHRYDPAKLSSPEDVRRSVERSLARIEGDFAAATWQAFHRAMSGERARDVATSLGISVNAVYLAKSKVLKRLREEMNISAN